MKGGGRSRARQSARTEDDDDDPEDDDPEDEDRLSAKIKASFDSIMASKKSKLAPDLCKLSPFRTDGLDLEQNSLPAKVVDAAYLFASVLPALAEDEGSRDFQTAADTLLDRLQTAEDRVDDLVLGLEALMENHEVESGVHKVMGALYPDRSSPDRIGKGSRKDRNLAISLRGASFDHQNLDADDQELHLDDMASKGPVRTSGRTRKSTARFNEAITELKSKRTLQTSNSPVAVSPSQPVYSKKIVLKINSNGNRSVPRSPVQVSTPQSDFVPSRSPSRRRGNRIKKPGTSPPTDSNSTNKESSKASSKMKGTKSYDSSEELTPAIPAILISHDSQEMPQPHLHRPDLVKNLLEAVEAIRLENFSSDDSDSESDSESGSESDLVNRETNGQILSSKHSPIRHRSAKDEDKTNATGEHSPQISRTTDEEKAAVSPTSSEYLVNGISCIDEGRAASNFYSQLAQAWNIPQVSPTSAGLPYPEFSRPMTDADGWTSTGILNEFGEEIVHVDRSKWQIYSPQASHGGHAGDEIQNRLKSKRQIAEDKIYGFPPQLKKQKLQHDRTTPFTVEDVSLETALYQTRKAMADRHLPYDESLGIAEMNNMIDESDRTLSVRSRGIRGCDMTTNDEDNTPNATGSPSSEMANGQPQSKEDSLRHARPPSSFNLRPSSRASASQPQIDVNKARLHSEGTSLTIRALSTSSRLESSNNGMTPHVNSILAQATSQISTPTSRTSVASGTSIPPTEVSSAASLVASTPGSSGITSTSPPPSLSMAPPVGFPTTPYAVPSSTPSTVTPPSSNSTSFPQVTPIRPPTSLIPIGPSVLPGPPPYQPPLWPQLPPPWTFNFTKSTPSFKPHPQDFGSHPGTQNGPFPNGTMPSNPHHANSSPPPTGQNYIFLDPNDSQKGPPRYPRSTAINGGPPGGGHVINPPRKPEPLGYKKKVGPDFKMELVNGRLSKPGPKPQPKPKRGGSVIDFTGY